MRRAGAKLGLILAMLFAGNIAHADPFEGPPEPRIFGDWGPRARLYEKGIDFQVGYVSELAYNAQGGIRNLVDYTDQVAVGATFNLERLFGFHDAVIQVTYTERAGRNLVDDAQLGTLQLVQEVYGRGQTVRLTQLWFEQEYFNRMVAWKVGRTSMGEDFALFPCHFQNLSFCGSDPGNIVGGYIFNWPISQWGSRVKVKLDGFGSYQVGAYDQNQQYLGFDNKLWPVFYQGSTGVLVPVELAWLPKFDGGKLPGSYRIGAWYSCRHRHRDDRSAVRRRAAVHRPDQLAAERRHCVRRGHYARQQSGDRGPIFAEFTRARASAGQEFRICFRVVLSGRSDRGPSLPSQRAVHLQPRREQPDQGCLGAWFEDRDQVLTHAMVAGDCEPFGRPSRQAGEVRP